MSERRQLINIAYRLLGSLAEAEDAVQETYARWYAMTRQQQDIVERQSQHRYLVWVVAPGGDGIVGQPRYGRVTHVGAADQVGALF